MERRDRFACQHHYALGETGFPQSDGEPVSWAAGLARRNVMPEGPSGQVSKNTFGSRGASYAKPPVEKGGGWGGR
jgi:hypothetical protein